jgi:hypothetical protein
MKAAVLALALGTAATLCACSSGTTSGHAGGGTGPASGAQTLSVSMPGVPASPATASATASATSAAPAAPADLPDACTVITRAEAQKLLGMTLQPGDDTRAGAADGVASCNYNAPVTGPSGSLGVYVQFGTPDALTTDRNLGHTFKAVPGIGDQTFEEPDNGSVFVRKGTMWAYVNVPVSTPASALVSAARLAASRLP